MANAPWTPRHSAGWLVHDNKIWVIGGDANSGVYQRDVWSFDGTTWAEVVSEAEPLTVGRVLHQVFSHAGKMWIVGGQTLDEFAVSDPAGRADGPYYDDVWSSEDGSTWTFVSDGHGWSPRGSIIGNAVKDGYMWLVGGGAYDTDGNTRVYHHDVWRSADGVSWAQVTPDGGFLARQYNSVAVLNGDLVLIAGYDDENIADAWCSGDGIAWRQLATVPWVARHAASVCSYNGEIVMLGGPLDETTVWALS
ncbi:hypothetical protein VE26_05635 [Devosia chinhatensis]|uniref:Galactose oxidase n=1 Tax=Devosia chinhatensis TaxID=429727 RepID=A0A0F5FKN5_9HYPH|nr:hypothetical protein VE26_05635 [Devosia chinhatensis]